MQAMKLLVVVVVAMVVTIGSANKCKQREWKKNFQKQQRAQRKSGCDCHEPRPTFVTIPPPQGYAYIYPNVVKVPRCVGLCMRGRTCMATHSKTLKFEVEGKVYTDEMNMNKECLTVPVVADEACACGCDTSKCTGNKVCRETDCQCKCEDTLKQACDERRARHEPVMWDPSTCTCPCDSQDTDCGFGEEFDMIVCRCIRKEWDLPISK